MSFILVLFFYREITIKSDPYTLNNQFNINNKWNKNFTRNHNTNLFMFQKEKKNKEDNKIENQHKRFYVSLCGEGGKYKYVLKFSHTQIKLNIVKQFCSRTKV